MQDIRREKGKQWILSLNDILKIFKQHVKPRSHILIHLMYTDKMKAQINEKSTIEISLYTQLTTGLFLND